MPWFSKLVPRFSKSVSRFTISLSWFGLSSIDPSYLRSVLQFQCFDLVNWYHDFARFTESVSSFGFVLHVSLLLTSRRVWSRKMKNQRRFVSQKRGRLWHIVKDVDNSTTFKMLWKLVIEWTMPLWLQWGRFQIKSSRSMARSVFMISNHIQ